MTAREIVGKHTLADVEATSALAGRFVRLVQPTDVVLLQGPLGVGKTTFVRCFMRALDFTGPVRSPTFALIHEYDARIPVAHVDLYRLDGTAGLGIEDVLGVRLCFIEWPDRLRGVALGDRVWRIEFRFSAKGRLATIQAPNTLEPNEMRHE